jgi:hypothetical protein
MDEAVTLVCGTLGVEYAKIDQLLPGGAELLVRAGAGWRNGVVGGGATWTRATKLGVCRYFRSPRTRWIAEAMSVATRKALARGVRLANPACYPIFPTRSGCAT